LATVYCDTDKEGDHIPSTRVLAACILLSLTAGSSSLGTDDTGNTASNSSIVACATAAAITWDVTLVKGKAIPVTGREGP
jgi:hypothetical protein